MAAAVCPVALPATDLGASLGAVNGSLDRTLDALEDALAQLQGSERAIWSAVPPRSGPSAEEEAELERHPATPVVMDTAAVHEQLRRTHSYFGGTAPSGGSPRSAVPGITAFGFSKLLRAARLLGEACTQVDADLIFCRVVKSRNGRMGLAQMISALSFVALRHFPAERGQPPAFHRLLTCHLLPWMLTYDFELSIGTLRQAAPAAVLGRHARFVSACFELYLSCPAQPV